MTVYSTHSGCNLVACSYDAAKATFISNGDDWRVCDLASDGERAKASITYTNSNGSIVTHYTEATGGSGTCVNDGVGVDIPEGRRVTVKVWHQDGAGGTPRDVTTGYGTA
ncbi:hypothetical protein ACPCAC_13575 [Streptomyces lavendulocolor]|uniref:hypothetical protein n=1 Tax=Streptomyces lavendulocolor TaxID=67316 RepID=UPI003C2C074F